ATRRKPKAFMKHILLVGSTKPRQVATPALSFYPRPMIARRSPNAAGEYVLALALVARLNQFMIEQAVYAGQEAGGYRFLARSPGFRDEWLAEAERVCTGFGERPAGVACPGCVFARPVGRH